MVAASEQAIRHYLSEFERRSPRLPLAGDGRLGTLRRAAIARLSEIGFPSVRDDEWKFTNVAPLLRSPFVAGAGAGDWERARMQAEIASLGLDEASPLLVFAAGRFVADLSRVEHLPAGLWAGSLGELCAGKDPRRQAAVERLGRGLEGAAHGFAALNAALFEDGAAIVVDAGAEIRRPIHLLFHGAPRGADAACLPRTLIVAGERSSASVVEHSRGDAGAVYLTDAATDIEVGRGARLGYTKVQAEPESAYHLHRLEASIGQGGALDCRAFSFGGALARSEVHVTLADEGAECRLAGLALAFGEQHADFFTSVDHAASRSTSHQLYKEVCGDRARGVFTGKVLVRDGTQGVSADQTNRNLLLSAQALVETRPELEIYADDVRCSHGATVGQLDSEMLFYMRQRGIDEAEARVLLTYGFANEVLASLDAGPLRDRLEEAIHARLPASL